MIAITAPWPQPASYRATYLRGRPDLEFGVDYRSREYCVRESIDDDHPTISNDANRALCRKRRRVKCITIIRLRDGRKWIFAEHSTSFPNGYQNTDAHALARLAANERAKMRLFGGVQ